MNLAPEIMNELFDIIESTNLLRNELRFKSQSICTVRYELKQLLLLAPGYGATCLVNQRRVCH